MRNVGKKIFGIREEIAHEVGCLVPDSRCGPIYDNDFENWKKNSSLSLRKKKFYTILLKKWFLTLENENEESPSIYTSNKTPNFSDKKYCIHSTR